MKKPLDSRIWSSMKLSGHQMLKPQSSSKATLPPFEGFKETLKDTESIDKRLQSHSKSRIKNRHDLSSVSRSKTTALDQVTQSSYPVWSDSSSETQPIYSSYKGANKDDNEKKQVQVVKEQKEERKRRKGKIKETLKKNMKRLNIRHKSSQTSTHMLSKQNSVSSQQLVGEWEKEKKKTNKTQSEAGDSVTELGQANIGFAEEPTDPMNIGVASEENIVVGIVKDVASYKDNRQVYHFDFGHQYFYETRKEYNEACISNLADWSDDAIRQCWRELFAVVRILVNMVTLFLIELVNFLSRSLFQILLVGLLTVIGDHLLKPLLVALFNSLLQPTMIFLLNIFTGIRNLLNPLIDIFRRLLMQIATVLHAFRLVEVNLNRAPSSYREV
ncbi:uncharacterized protein [Heptranchias perlo]|uniref:uncharacterized protein isoform X2 n=1 Tax=Heptranchias perlo TaxID=212740 RepID=UPI00355AB162